jgi:hypothetical protein
MALAKGFKVQRVLNLGGFGTFRIPLRIPFGRRTRGGGRRRRMASDDWAGLLPERVFFQTENWRLLLRAIIVRKLEGWEKNGSENSQNFS